MQDRPSANILLEAIQDFLIKEILPAVKENDALSYKTLVSWNMLSVVSREFKNGEITLDKEISRLQEHLGEKGYNTDGVSYYSKMEIASKLNSIFANEIREKKISNDNKEVWNLVKLALREKLEITNPKFLSGED
jgi:hypothetical protein